MIHIKNQQYKTNNYCHHQPTTSNVNVILNTEQYKHNSIFFCEPIKNNIMSDGNFIRIIYSSSLFTLNGIYIKLPIHITHIEKYYNKYKYNFDKGIYSNLIEYIRLIEEDILKKVNISKLPQYKIVEQLNTGHLKIITDIVDATNIENNNLLLKISGVWETDTEYGITYKFVNIIHPS